MRNEVVVAWVSLALAGCGPQSREDGGGTGVGGRGGLSGSGGAPAAGHTTSLSGETAVSGSSSSGSSVSSNWGSSSTAETSGLGGFGGLGGATVQGGTPGAGGATWGGTTGSSTGGTGVGAESTSGTGGALSAGGALGTSQGAGGVGGGASTCAIGLPAPTPGDSTVTLQHGGRSRKYILHVPTGVTAGTPLALVFDLHGAYGDGAQQKGMSGFSALADREHFLAVFPDGIDGYWNVDDKCCGTAGKEKIDDVGFLRTIITTLSAETCIDAARIYVSGFSNGGGLAHRMGCDAADVIAAIAPVATDLRTQPCNAVRPISMLEVRPMADSVEPYEGGLVGPEGGQYEAVGGKASLALWAAINECTGTPTMLADYCETFTECSGGVETALCSLPNVDHNPYNNALGFDVAGTAWSMFQRHSLE